MLAHLKAPFMSRSSHWPLAGTSDGTGARAPTHGFYMWLLGSLPTQWQVLRGSTPRPGRSSSPFYGFTSNAIQHHFYYNHRSSNSQGGNTDSTFQYRSVIGQLKDKHVECHVLMQPLLVRIMPHCTRLYDPQGQVALDGAKNKCCRRKGRTEGARKRERKGGIL